MKKTILGILALMIFTQINIFAQWTNIYTNNNDALVAVKCINEDTVYVADYNSKVLRTFDKGQTWQEIDPGLSINNMDMDFPDAYTGYIVGMYGKIAKTSDCGDNWDLIVTDTNYTLKEVVFTNSDTGWIIANTMIPGYDKGLILRTYNGGESWDYFYFDGYELLDLEMINNSKGMIGIHRTGFFDDYGFLKTEDGGDTWNLSNSELSFINTVSFINENIGYCTSFTSGLNKTIDGGSTWENIPYGYEIGKLSSSKLLFLTGQTGFYAGWDALADYGEIYRTDNSGNTWSEQISDRFRDIDMLNTDLGYAVTETGKIYKTINGGIPVGVAESNNNQKSDIAVFPNPAKDFITLRLKNTKYDNDMEYKCFDAFGTEVYSGKINQAENVIDVRNWSTGIYLVVEYNKNVPVSKCKLIIK